MAARIEGRIDRADPWLTARARSAGGVRLSTSADRFAGYQVWLEAKSGPAYKYRVQTLLSYQNRPYSRYIVEFVTVKRSGTTYLVDEIEYLGQREAIARAFGTEIWLKWLTREARLLKVSDLPDTFKPYGADVLFGVGKNRFTALALSPDGKRVAFAAGGTHGFLGVLTIHFDGDEITTPPLMEGLDLYFGGGARELIWSPSGKYLAVLVDTPGGFTALHVWEMSRHRRLELQNFPVLSGVWAVKEPQWSPDGRLVFHIETGSGTKGPYHYNPQTQRVDTP